MLYISFGLRLKMCKKKKDYDYSVCVCVVVGGAVIYPTDWVYSTKGIMNFKEGCFSFEIWTFCKAKFKGKISLFVK